jgi:hypothetical protein
METELVALDSATIEVEWLRELFMDLTLVEKPIPPISMYCDNQTMSNKIEQLQSNHLYLYKDDPL